MDILGSGSYGCVYKDNEKNKIIKYLFENNKFISELKNTLLINFIDNKDSIMIEDAEIKQIEEKDKPNLDKCDIYINNKNEKQLENIYQLIYDIKYYGKDLVDVFKYNILELCDIIKLCLPLYDTLLLYSKFEIIHCDIKIDNILYLEKLNKTIIIDYGLVQTFDKVYKNTALLDFTYLVYPPEFKLIANTKNEYVEDFIDDFKNNFKNYQIIKDKLKIVYPEHDNDLIDMYNSNRRFNKTDKTKIDLYSLSMSLFYLITLQESYNKPIKEYEYIKKIEKEILIPSINFNVRKRPSIFEIVSKLKTLNNITQQQQ